jgi:hypothetical protein
MAGGGFKTGSSTLSATDTAFTFAGDNMFVEVVI